MNYGNDLLFPISSYFHSVTDGPAAYLFSTGKTYYGLGLLALIIPQIILQFQYFLKDPLKYDVKYQASAQPFFVFGLLLTALATSH
jgi:chlorophyll synthase